MPESSSHSLPEQPRPRLRTIAPPLLCHLATTLLVVAMAASPVIADKWQASGSSSMTLSLAVASAMLVAASLAAGIAYVSAFRLGFADRRTQFWRPLATGWLVALALGIGLESFLRQAAVPTTLGVRVGDLELLPLDWEHTRSTIREWRSRTQASDNVFEVEDPDLGWDLGRARESADGLYVIGVDGARVGREDQAAPSDDESPRVALIGDSFTFGEEVPFQQTWGYFLERELGGELASGAAVSNFGVPSHGVDQTILKYRRDVRGLNPDVVVLSFLSASPQRNSNMYLFLRPALELPFSKPRFVLPGDGPPATLNDPPLSPDRMLALARVEDLPWLGHESEFIPQRWARRPYHRLYLSRWLVSRYPSWPAKAAQHSDAAIVDLAARLLILLDGEARQAGSEPLFVSLPVRADLTGGPTHLRDALIEQLDNRGIPVIELAPCMLRHASIDDLFLSQSERRIQKDDAGPPHYSPTGNAAVANCLTSPVLEALRKRRGTSSGS